MKKVIPFLICLCCCSSLCHGQDKKIDSLIQVLISSKEDTAKVNTLNRLAIKFKSNNPDTAIYLATEAKVLAIKLDYKMGVANAYWITGSVENPVKLTT
jgi:two-component system, NtrC family, sensor kinase